MTTATTFSTKYCLLLTLIPFLAAVACSEQHGDEATGKKIFTGLQDTFLYLLTPQVSPVAGNEGNALDFENKEQQNDIRNKFKALQAQHLHEKMKDPTYNPDASNYFKFIPNYIETLTLGKTYKIDIPCYQDASVTALDKVDASDSPVDVVFELHEPVSLTCRAAFVISTDTETFIKEFWTSGTHSVSFSHPTTDAEAWDLNRGPRLYGFPTDLEAALGSLASTLLLFEPTLTQGVTWPFDEWNLNFLRDFAGIEMPKRTFDGSDEDTSYIPDPSLIRSGDTFNILRLDGLDPMIAWAMGSATGHTTVAMWKDDELFVCESNAKSGYWPINGIQCNKYNDWMEYGKNANYNTVWVPLSEENAARFDETKAWAFIEEHMGIDYGWEVVLTGWLDVNDGNAVCVDLNRTWCLEPEHHLELLFSVAERVSDEAAKIFIPAMMQRAQVSDFNSSLVEAYYKAYVDGLDYTNLHNMVELDTYEYPTTKYEEPFTSDVSICNVFVCKVFRASGIFGDLGDQFNCGEVSVNDMYRLNIYDENTTENRPKICKERDPENPLCQVLGDYALRLDSQPGVPPRYNYVSLYSDFGSQCPSEAPDYLAPADC